MFQQQFFLTKELNQKQKNGKQNKRQKRGKKEKKRKEKKSYIYRSLRIHGEAIHLSI